MSIIEVSQNADVQKVAALDLGSNSFHLVVARIVADDVQILHQLKLRARLAEGLDEDNLLSQEAIERGLDHLRIFAESLTDFGPDQVRIVATYTLRRAKNAREFVKAAKKIFPYPVEVISGVEEARLIYMGVAHTIYHEGNRLVLDIGGGSTEIILGEGFDPKLRFSLSMGCVTYTRRFFSGGRITRKRMNNAIKAARTEIEVISEPLIRMGWEHCLGSSGTVQAILNCVVELNHQLSPDDERKPSIASVTLVDLEMLADTCIEAGNTMALSFTGISATRRDVFPAGLSVLIGLFHSLGIESICYSPAALREGVIYEMGDILAERDIRERTAQSLVTRYVVDIDQAKRVENTAHLLFNQVRKSWETATPELEQLLSWAALLHEVGLQINSRNSHKHAEYILKNIDMPGFNQEQQAILATLVRFQRKKIRKEEFAEFLFYSPSEINQMIVLLRLSVLLNFKRQDQLLPELKAQAVENQLSLKFPKGWLDAHEVFESRLEQEKRYLKMLEINLEYR